MRGITIVSWLKCLHSGEQSRGKHGKAQHIQEQVKSSLEKFIKNSVHFEIQPNLTKSAVLPYFCLLYYPNMNKKYKVNRIEISSLLKYLFMQFGYPVNI